MTPLSVLREKLKGRRAGPAGNGMGSGRIPALPLTGCARCFSPVGVLRPHLEELVGMRIWTPLWEALSTALRTQRGLMHGGLLVIVRRLSPGVCPPRLTLFPVTNLL